MSQWTNADRRPRGERKRWEAVVAVVVWTVATVIITAVMVGLIDLWFQVTS